MPNALPSQDTAPRWIFYTLLALVATFPLPLGGIYQWSWASLGVAVAFLLMAWVVALYRNPDLQIFWPSEMGLCGLFLPVLLFFGVVLWASMQAWFTAIGPAEIWASTAEVLQRPVAWSLSLAPEKTTASVIQLLSAGAVFWLSVQYGRVNVLARRGLWVLAISGLLYAVYGLTSVLSGSEMVLWFAKTSYRGNVTGTYVNRNMYAFYAGLGLLTSCSLLLERIAAAQRKGDGLARGLQRALVAQPNLVVGLSTTILVYLVAIGFTESRGGALASATAVSVFLVVMVLRGPRFGLSNLVLGSLGFAGIWLIVYAVTAAHLGGRFQTQFFDDGGRFDAYLIMLSAIADSPWQGYGYGVFAELFSHRNDGAIWKAYYYPHNLYLGAAVELGVLAALALFSTVALITLACATGVSRRRRHQAFSALGLAATILLACHGLVDSPLFVPANLMTYSCLLGLAYGQAFPTRNRGQR